MQGPVVEEEKEDALMLSLKLETKREKAASADQS
jgi:hypothetical protein